MASSWNPLAVFLKHKQDQSDLGLGRTDLEVNWNWSLCKEGGVSGGVE